MPGLVAACTSAAPVEPRVADAASVGPIASLPSRRPILFVDRTPRALATRGVYADGTAWEHSIDSIGMAWSPRGDWFTEVWGYVNLNLRNLRGEAKIVHKSGLGVRLWERPCWSPDASKLATIEISRNFRSASLVVVQLDDAVLGAPGVEVAHRLKRSRHALPAGVAGGRGLYAISGAQFRWSPDGTRILLAWDKVVVFDVPAARFETLVDGPALAEWAPDGRGVYYFDVGLVPPAPGETPAALAAGRSANGFYYRALGQAPAQRLLDAPGVAGLDLTIARVPMHPWGLTLTLSPRSDRLLITGSTLAGDAARLLVYDLRGPGLVDLRKPARTCRAPGLQVVAVEWSPDRRDLIAAATVTDSLQIQTFDLQGGWTVLSTTAFPVVREPSAELMGIDLLSWSQ